jgi:hypothetical protein
VRIFARHAFVARGRQRVFVIAVRNTSPRRSARRRAARSMLFG